MEPMTPPERTAHPRFSVLVLIKSLDLGGAEKLLVDGARFWDQHAFDYTVAYVIGERAELVPNIARLGLDVVCIGSPTRTTASTPFRLRRLISERSIDLVHVHSPATAVVARLASTVPIVYTEHNVPGAYRFSTRFGNRLTYRRNTAVIAVSNAVAAAIARYGGPTPIVVPNGVDVSLDSGEAAAARGELGIEPGAALVVHVGNIRPEKGHDVLLDAAAVLEAEHPDLTIVSIGGGKHPSDIDRLRSEARRRGLVRTRFLGPRSDALRFMAAADVVVNPSTYEGLPLAVLEAMALARPIVATAVGGVPGIIRDGETGILVAPGRPDLLAAAVARSLADPGLATRMAETGRAVVLAEHGLESMVRAIEGVYREVLDG